MTIALVYGFEPFLGMDENPSELVVKALPKMIAGARIETLVLPVNQEKVEAILVSKVEELKPDLVIGLGLLQGLPKLGITKMAANFRYSQSKDNAGKKMAARRIDKDSPDGIFMSIRSETLVEFLNRKGIPSMLLITAEAYLCNLSMFVVARESRRSGFACGFIHLPFAEEFVARHPEKNAASMPLDRMVQGVEQSIKYCLKDMKSAPTGI